MFVEAIVAMLVLLFAGSLILALLKLVFAVVLLPIKLAFFLTKGLLALVIGLPLLVLGGLVFGAVLPVVLLVILAPVWILGGLACAFLA
jgi:hypothetical protein